MSKNKKDNIIVSLDLPYKEATKLVSQLSSYVNIYKVGYPLFISSQGKIVKYLKEAGKKVVLDFKLHDIPNTVYLAVKNIIKTYEPFGITLHISGGCEMLTSAVSAAKECNSKVILFGITILTSLTESDLYVLFSQSVKDSIEAIIIRMAEIASYAGLNGIVCSGQEIATVRKVVGDKMKIMVPGIRIKETADSICKDDQKRTSTPEYVIQCGADYIVLGRSLYTSKDPVSVVKKISKIK
jgi:orotidine-5'-phosphate decarboxylase